MTLKVQFKGSLLEMKAWLAEMPDNLAAVFWTEFEATTSPAPAMRTSGLESCGPEKLREAYNVAKVEMSKGLKIQAIKEVRQVTGAGLKQAKDFVEANFQAL